MLHIWQSNTTPIAINLCFLPAFFWFLFPLAGWSIGIVAHHLGVTRREAKNLEQMERGAEYAARTRGV